MTWGSSPICDSLSSYGILGKIHKFQEIKLLFITNIRKIFYFCIKLCLQKKMFSSIIKIDLNIGAYNGSA